jgi:hypothetical protein
MSAVLVIQLTPSHREKDRVAGSLLEATTGIEPV